MHRQSLSHAIAEGRFKSTDNLKKASMLWYPWKMVCPSKNNTYGVILITKTKWEMQTMASSNMDHEAVDVHLSKTHVITRLLLAQLLHAPGTHVIHKKLTIWILHLAKHHPWYRRYLCNKNLWHKFNHWKSDTIARKSIYSMQTEDKF
jgi:hypothetical protein